MCLQPARSVEHCSSFGQPYLFVFITCGQGRGRAQCPRTAAPPQQPSRRNLRCWRELRQPGRKVCGEAPQRCSHRHLHSLCGDFLIRCTYAGQRERAPSHGWRAPVGRRRRGGKFRSTLKEQVWWPQRIKLDITTSSDRQGFRIYTRIHNKKHTSKQKQKTNCTFKLHTVQIRELLLKHSV